MRLFRSDLLEIFTHVHPLPVAGFWSLVIGLFLYRSFSASAGIEGQRLLGLILVPAGWFIWTFAEYALHRFLFHYAPRSEKGKRIAFYMHGVHHTEPLCKTRLVMPPPVSVPLALLFYLLFWGVSTLLSGTGDWAAPLMAGFLGGYLIYDMLHYSMHHLLIGKSFLLGLRTHHLRHHGQRHDMRFGITTRFWDRLFGTLPE
jgi:sterol desaturase/sphingolipid hydroxylase (fatty acid hydroxylase superfamily)